MTDSKQQDNLVGVTERFIGRRIVHTELRTSHIPAKDSLMQGVMACYRTELCFSSNAITNMEFIRTVFCFIKAGDEARLLLGCFHAVRAWTGGYCRVMDTTEGSWKPNS